jgi:hypothetical protein
MHCLRRFCSGVIALLVLAPKVEAQRIIGSVVDSSANTKVSAANVLLLQAGHSEPAVSDSSGRFTLRANPGVFKIIVNALGYSAAESGELRASTGEVISLLVFLTKDPLIMSPVVVVATTRRPLNSLDLFERRMERIRRTGMGHFLDSAALNKGLLMSVSDALRRVPGVRSGGDYVAVRPTCSDPVYLVDGMPVRAIESPNRSQTGQTATYLVNAMLSVHDIAGIEVYKGSSEVPGELAWALGGAIAGSRSCGLVAIWLKR